MPKLCKAGVQLREQLDDDYGDRDRKSDGWIADARHIANRKSDHIPDIKGIVRAIDIDANLNAHPEEAYAVVEKLRKLAKRGDKRIKYIIYDRKIASSILNWKWRKYKGPNPHVSHFHVSFTKLGDNNGKWFDLEGERNDAGFETSSSDLVQDIPSGSTFGLSSRRNGCCCHCKCSSSISLAQHY